MAAAAAAEPELWCSEDLTSDSGCCGGGGGGGSPAPNDDLEWVGGFIKATLCWAGCFEAHVNVPRGPLAAQ
jgi:hypothetical protein